MLIRYFKQYKLRKNVKNFLNLSWCDASCNGVYYGWGRKESGKIAKNLAKKNNAKFCLLEDGLIRSLGLGINDKNSFSLVFDDIGIYYDATTPSRLENILNTYEFNEDELQKARKAIKYLVDNNISKYNNAYKEFKLGNKDNVLVILQSANDLSLKYGLANNINSLDMIKDAIKENPSSKIYVKIHPDTLNSKKQSDININEIPQECEIISDSYNPIILLKNFKKVYTKTSTMGFEALLCGCECVCYGMPFYAGWGITKDKQKCERRIKIRNIEEIFYAMYFLYTKYYNPYSEDISDIFDTMKTIVQFREIYKANSGRLFFFGFSLWKRAHTKHFFKSFDNKIIFMNSLSTLKRYKVTENDKAFIWGKKYDKDELEKYFKNVSIVEDGFIRSIGLGSNLTKAYSLVVDDMGIYFDPQLPSRLEYILKNTDFNDELIQEAKEIRKLILDNSFSKYNCLKHKELQKREQKTILIPAQVEDDASIKCGGLGYDTLRLIKQVKIENPNAYIIYKVHPDVVAGNRKGLNDEKIILKYCDEIITDISIDSCIKACDEVHTITSTAGYDALIRDKVVVTYGAPFYAGWGLTIDKNISPEILSRRSRNLSINELIAGVIILYPRYLNLKLKLICKSILAIHKLIQHKN
ncbi:MULTISPECIES: capsular polysaccharide biosynthesis protein [unclassified Campylobacter]|uniref:capsular polysaccharide biosynthesis protein n=1 Tax=unclassified Campylobacter TaxID=2593542 RepID=UPI001D9322C3|nr:capsular polysaccharide biosynthesis protein [Campylobacter sp. RM9331]MBZ8005865.1 capsular polysaccharide biosynthesis protein [Campylobacter sp. RM9332]